MSSSNGRRVRYPFTVAVTVVLVLLGGVILLFGKALGVLRETWFLCLCGLYLLAAAKLYVIIRVVEDAGGRPTLWSKLFNFGFRVLNALIPWYRLRTVVGSLNLLALRNELREHNLHDTSGGLTNDVRVRNLNPTEKAAAAPLEWKAEFRSQRTADGTFNSIEDPLMGSAGTRFGRNTPLDRVRAESPAQLQTPSPREVSRRLMTRETFVPAKTLNLLAAAWIQFENHDWISHGRIDQCHEIPLGTGDTWPENPMRIRRTEPDGSNPAGSVPTFINSQTHWWDASHVYGSSQELQNDLRANQEGKLKLVKGRLPADPDPKLSGVDLTGFNSNYWVGLSLLHTLFALEHNAICDRLRREYPTWGDDQLFQTARLVNAALIAKIHTVEWTPAILGHPALQLSMNGNWSGLLGMNFKLAFGRASDSEVISGITGSPTHQHGAPYYLTEEFTSVYRLHPLIPDEYVIRSVRDHQKLADMTFNDLQGNKTRPVMQQMKLADLFYSFGVANPGAVTLHNYPHALQNFEFIKETNPSRIDLAAVDVLRDRERGVPRYNDFREMLRRGRVKSFGDLTNNPRWAKEIEDLYEGDINRVDLMVGLYAETPPPGFGFSETAFRIFILMASRRLKSDRFFTVDYTPAVYTPAGIEWIEHNNMRTVLQRHVPELTPALQRSSNAFAPWSRVR